MTALDALRHAVEPLADRRHLATAGLVTAFALVGAPFEWLLKPLARQFRLDNPQIAYPYAAEHVPAPLLAFLVVVLPIGALVLSGAASARFRRHSAVSLLGFALSLTATFFVCNVLKFLIGNQRPDFLARCMPKPGISKDVYVTVEAVCTNPDMGSVWEGCRSTPSGHSALSFASMGFLTLWLGATFEVERRPRSARLAALLPMALAVFVAYTRIIDHKHHWVDVIGGGLLGGATAYVSYFYAVQDSKPEKSVQYSPV